MAYKKSAISAAQIVSAATRVLARKGYARSSLSEIAREAGMSKGAVHYHFSTKEALVSRVLESATETVTERTMKAWSPTESEPIRGMRSSVRELWDARTRGGDEVKVIADLIAQSLYDESLRPPLSRFYRFASQQVIEELIDRLAFLGVRPKVAPELIPRMVLGLLDGLAMQHFVEPGVIDADELAKAVELMAFALFEPIPPGERPEASEPAAVLAAETAAEPAEEGE